MEWYLIVGIILAVLGFGFILSEPRDTQKDWEDFKKVSSRLKDR